MEIKNVSILGQKYKLTLKAPKEYSQEQIESYYGTCQRDKSIIWINEKLDIEQRYRTLFQEMGHGLMYRSGVSFSGVVPLELEEIIVETFASMQYEFLRDFLKQASKGKLIDDISKIIS
jgi:Zn-dependent peptidase ImmA (M78 family)